MVDVKPGRPISCRGRRTPTADRLQVGEKRKLTRLRSDLLNWARQAGRVYPWRANAASSYERIVVEVLLQRTTATAVSKFYDALRPVARPERTFHDRLAGAFRDHGHNQSAPRNAVVIVDLCEARLFRPSDKAA